MNGFTYCVSGSGWVSAEGRHVQAVKRRIPKQIPRNFVVLFIVGFIGIRDEAKVVKFAEVESCDVLLLKGIMGVQGRQ